MKLKVLIPSDEYKSYAGARIRYGRLASELVRHGIELMLEDIAAFAPEKDGADVLLISKCHDARALVAAASACARGQLVGVDLFDDYFSQFEDGRLNRYRLWLKQLLETCHFALCSTPTMARVVDGYRPGLPVHVVNDPAPNADGTDLAQLLNEKLANTRNGLTLRLAWFGVGDNPHFRVGLSDLAAFGNTLSEFGGSGMDVELTVLTNGRALTADGLALIHRVPVRTRVKEWTEERERELLAEAFACFLPVNAQRFSAAKSLNRGITALSAGCQVISVGYPLYEALSNLIYRDAASFLSDLRRGEMKHSAAGIGKYEGTVDTIASAELEAARLAGFLGQIPSVAVDDRPIALVHGQATSGAAHKTVRALHGFSVGSPYCAAELGFDVVFRPSRHGLVMLISDQTAKRVAPKVRASLVPARSFSERKFWIVLEGGEGRADEQLADQQWHNAPLPFQLATYGSTMACISERLQDAFGPCRVFISESSPLPFSSTL
jgi:hypothetical protein